MIDGQPALESEFSIKIGDKTVYGKIDRIDDRGQGKVVIIDYKTGNPKDKLDDSTKAQLLIYQIAAKQVHKAEPVELIYYYLEDGSTLSFLGTDEDIENLMQEFEDFQNALKQSNFDPTPGRHCDFCDFRDICEFRE
jgi:RecB family exonuclease